jgi:hypothetical protein
MYALGGDETPPTVTTTVWSPAGIESGICIVNAYTPALEVTPA